MLANSLLNCLAIAVLSHFIWRLYIFPCLLSPLRHIPYANVDWATLIYRWLYAEPEPPRIAGWAKTSRHQGLLRYPGIGGQERVLMLKPEAVREALVTHAYSTYQRAPRNRQRLAAMMGNGVLVAEGDSHRAQKRKLQPAFAPRNIHALHPTFWSKACEMVDQVTAYQESEMRRTGRETATVELLTFTSRAALDIIGIAAWGKDFSSLANPDSDFHRQYHAFFVGSRKSNLQAKFIHAAALAVSMQTLAKWIPCEFFRNIANGRRALREACSTVIAEKREQHAEGIKTVDILEHAMSTELFEDEELINQMRNILGAGHTTTARSAVFTCYLLARHTEVQARLRAEIRENLPSPKSREIGQAEILDTLPYMRAVVREALRVFPVVPSVPRESMRPTTLLGQPIPPGTVVVSSPWIMNTLESVWGPDAKDFRPERWLEKDLDVPSQAYLSFSAGPRSCIGEAFATAELAALIAVLIGRFDIRLADPNMAFPKVVWGISTVPIGLRFDLRRIDVY